MRRAPLLLPLVLGLAACQPHADAPPVVPASDPGESLVQAVSEAPEGMVYVPGGTTTIGSDDGLAHERPRFEATVAPFYLDRSPVTVAAFRAFVEDTGFETEAERFGNAGVLDTERGGWTLRDGADWRYPLGPAAAPAADDHPATQVSWHDAAAYCDWAGKRLPTETEWEHAARGATNSDRRYAWGDELADGDRYFANTWTGTFPAENTAADGFSLTSPVGLFGETPLGLTDMGGNVWEWTADWYRSYADRDAPFTPTATSEKVQRGGSFLCHPSYCHGYRVSARSHATPETSLMHVGFRCAQDAEGNVG
ncbi:MAG: formylglycine-generating enzyme family protein [Rhodothermales bacterium]|nr:formylglycine-generating enzyme family protein [Rhodothermales bacterium]